MDENKTKNRVDCNFFEVSQERTENRTAYFRVDKNIKLADVEYYFAHLPDIHDNYFPEWDDPAEDDFIFSQTDLDLRLRPYSFINDITVNDDNTKWIISNKYTTGVLFRDLTSCPDCGADYAHRKIIH